jgi:RNA polymerase sigma factor (sigma-70 family)
LKDQDIIRLIKEGNEDPAIEYLYAKVFPLIFSWIKKNNGSRKEAQDIFQETILILYKQIKIGKFDEKYEIQGFMFSVSRNLWVNFIKRKNKQEGISSDLENIHDEYNALSNLISEEREEIIVKVFSQLGERCKELLVLSFFHQFSYKEISERMGFASDEVVKTKKYKCKQRLMEIVGDGKMLKRILQ